MFSQATCKCLRLIFINLPGILYTSQTEGEFSTRSETNYSTEKLLQLTCSLFCFVRLFPFFFALSLFFSFLKCKARTQWSTQKYSDLLTCQYSRLQLTTDFSNFLEKSRYKQVLEHLYGSFPSKRTKSVIKRCLAVTFDQ